jgi:hypothetical protein
MTSPKRKIGQPTVKPVSTAVPDGTVTIRETFYGSMNSLEEELATLDASLNDLRARTHNLRTVEETPKKPSEPTLSDTTHLLTRLNSNISRLRQLCTVLNKTALEFDV